MTEVYIVTITGDTCGTTRAHVMADDHRDALVRTLNRFPGIHDMDTVTIVKAEATALIL